MTKTNNIIELNGKQFDAVTGAFLGVKKQSVDAPKVIKSSALPRQGQRGTVMDSVVISPSAHKVQHMPVKKPVRQHSAPKPLAAHKPEHTKTLMRHVVKQPAVKPKTALKTQVPTDVIKKQPAVLAVKPKLSSDVVDLKRSARALSAARSPKIERFRQAPQPRRLATSHNAQPLHATRLRATEGFAPVKPQQQITRVSQQPRPTARPQNNSDMFERALANAKSHEQVSPHHQAKQRKRKHARFAGITASVLVVLALGGFIAFQNRANMELQLASARAGFHASLPGYKPTGFAFKGLKYSPGTVTVGYGTADKSFNVTQKESNWNSETLLENVVATAGEPYQAYQAAGRTVYIYDNGTATWVNGGVWYQVNGTANLNKDQLLNLASSM